MRGVLYMRGLWLPAWVFLAGLLFVGTAKGVRGQEVMLDYQNEPLNEILLDLSARYQVQVSIDARLSGGCVLTVQEAFSSVASALAWLAAACNLEMVQIAQVYTFRWPSPPAADSVGAAEPAYLYAGQVVGARGVEPLPYTVVRVGQRGVVTDHEGRFAFASAYDQVVVRGEHLGYRIADTVLRPGSGLVLRLQEQAELLAEVAVAGRSLVSVSRVGEQAGHMRLNHVSNSHLPGGMNNLIFNNLRMYPGINAAGEAVSDYVIWGSYPGQNYVAFDDITLFSSWGVNQEIGRINPAMVKDVQVYKGGYQVPFGDRTGGVILMEGRRGDRKRPWGDVQLTNQLANGYVNIPLLGNRASLQLAARQTFAATLAPLDVPLKGTEDILSENRYGDYNVKFSVGLTTQDHLDFNLMGSHDSYKATVEDDRRRGDALVRNYNAGSDQLGGSVRYTRTWANGTTSRLVFAQSRYNPTSSSFFFYLDGEVQETRMETRWENTVRESTLRFTHRWVARGRHQWEGSLAWVDQSTAVTTGTPDRFRALDDQGTGRISGYLMDRIQLTPAWQLQVGLKADWLAAPDSLYLQPRLSSSYRLGEAWRINAAWGRYRQFLLLAGQRDVIGNASEVWRIADGSPVPVQDAEHTVLGVSWQRQRLQLTVEGFYKKLSVPGVFREVGLRPLPLYIGGRGIARGLDVFLRREQGRHALWLAYTLSKTEERLGIGNWRAAPQDQRHELKGAWEWKMPSFAFALTHVYGSGYVPAFQAYHRTDVSAAWFLPLTGVDAELGASVLNVFNRRNLQQGQTVVTPEGQTLSTLGLPFTPSVYARVRF